MLPYLSRFPRGCVFAQLYMMRRIYPIDAMRCTYIDTTLICEDVDSDRVVVCVRAMPHQHKS